MTPADLVKMIHSIDRQMDESRHDMADLAADRSAAIRELIGLVGAVEAARKLKISRTAVWRAAKER